MKRPLFVFLSLLLLSLGARAQRTNDLWYFGQQAGLSFVEGNVPKPLNDGKMSTYEGSAVATTASGQLLFYTNGETVWNREHRPMPNGHKLMGSGSSTQSALIVPDPGSGNIFYIFTVAPQGTPNGLRYSVLDMTRDDGLGDLPRVNLLLIQPVAEKLTAVRHANGRDTWVLAHRWNSNAFVAYLVTADGVQSAKPIMSNVGSMNAGPGRNAIGALKFSPDGKHLAASLWKETNRFEIYDFDRSTGKVSNARGFGPYPEAYGVEFSPDGSKLYGTCNGLGGGQTQLWQFDLKTKKPTLVGKSANRKVGALQRGPDGRIYVAREDNPNLGIIQYPDSLGKACRYIDEGIKLGGRRSKLGLPNFVTIPGGEMAK
jgi:WD40 repeat protein